MRLNIGSLTIIVALLCASTTTFGQSTSTNTAISAPEDWAHQTINFGSLNLSVPQSPAFVVLGLTPQNVVHPTTPQQFAASLLNGTDQNGNFQSGVAIDTAPYMVFEGNDLTIDQYQNSRLDRFLARSTFSFATTKGANANDTSVKLASGLRLTIFDLGDPRMDKSMDDAFKQAAGNFRAPPPGQTDFLKDPFNASAIQTIQQAEAERNWNRSSWIIGAAPSWIDKGGGNFTWNGAAIYSSVAYGFEQFDKNYPILSKNAQLLFGIQYFNNQQVATNGVSNKFYTQDSLILGSDLRIGTPDFNGTIEGAFVHTWPSGMKQDSFARVAGSLEKKISDGVWIELSIGEDIGARNQPSTSLLGSIKFGWSSKSTMK